MKDRSSIKNILILLVLAIGVLSIFSTSSFLYSANPWSDANVFFTIGRGIVDGKRMYIDLFDHKGPLTYWLYALAALISSHSFIGVFILEIIAFFFFLLFTQKIVRIYHRGNHYFALIVMSIVTVTGSAFNFGGGSVEEYAMPVFTGILYLALSTMHEKKSFSYSFCRWTGAALAFTFFLKYSMCGFFIGLAIAVVIYQYRIDKKKILPCIGIVIGTFALITGVICLILFGNGIFSAFVETYFHFNLSNYATAGSRIAVLTRAFTRTLLWYARNNILSIPFIYLGIFQLFISKDYSTDEKWLVALTFVLWYGVLMIGGQSIYYYIYPIYMFSFSMICALASLQGGWQKTSVAVCAAMCAGSFVLSANLPRLGKQDVIQNELDAVMKQYSDHPTLLMYHAYDEGFYLKENYIPSCRYFTSVNTEIADFDTVSLSCISQEQYDFLIAMSNDPSSPAELDVDGYELLEQRASKYLYDGKTRVYSLYIRSDLLRQN